MYKFICAQGHVSHSGAINVKGGCGHADCGELRAYRIVGAEEAYERGVRSNDCTRWVQYDDLERCLDARTGLAYSHPELRRHEGEQRAGRLRSS